MQYPAVSAIKKSVCLILFPLVLSGLLLFPRTAVTQGSLILFDDALYLQNRADWSYDTDLAVSNDVVFAGDTSLKLTHTAGWGAFYIRFDEPLAVEADDEVRLMLHSGTGGQRLRVRLADEEGNWLEAGVIDVRPDDWQAVAFKVSELGNPTRISGVVLQNGVPDPAASYHIDEVQLVFATAEIDYRPQFGVNVPVYPMAVDTFTVQHDISDLIYGVNLSTYELNDQLNLPVSRYGGNSTSRYNWQTGSTNLGHNWYFMNQARSLTGDSLPNGTVTDQFVAQNRAAGTDSMLTVPLMGWVSKSREAACGFSVEKYGGQMETAPYHPDCGRGVLTNGGKEPILWADPADSSVAVDEAFVQDWIRHLHTTFGTAEGGGVRFYSMDNEPMLWHATHQDVHPRPTTYDEILEKTLRYAPAVKAVDPAAQIVGPAVWGWHAYFKSALDMTHFNGAIDRAAHGGVSFLEWYLQQMALYEVENDQRILDYLDLHYYPQGDGIAQSPAGDLATQAHRLRSTRSLWDPSYIDESWIRQPVKLIPRMHGWVSRNYPGTQTSISEYNFGGLEHINGAVTQADVLGIFGRERLDMALLWGWTDLQADQPWAYAFRLYRNYDGRKSTFGDQSLAAMSINESDLSIFAARRSADDALTLMVINKTWEPAIADIDLAGLGSAQSAEIYRYDGSNLTEIRFLGNQAIVDGRIKHQLPGQSIVLFVIKNGSYTRPPAPALPLTPVPTATPVEDPFAGATPPPIVREQQFFLPLVLR